MSLLWSLCCIPQILQQEYPSWFFLRCFVWTCFPLSTWFSSYRNLSRWFPNKTRGKLREVFWSVLSDYRRFAPIPIRPVLVRPHFLLPQNLSAPNTYLFAPCKFQFAPCPESSVAPVFISPRVSVRPSSQCSNILHSIHKSYRYILYM